MAASKCTKCGSMAFEIKEMNPTGARYRLFAVQCTVCGGVVGVMDFMNIGAMMEDLERSVKRIIDRVGA